MTERRVQSSVMQALFVANDFIPGRTPADMGDRERIIHPPEKCKAKTAASGPTRKGHESVGIHALAESR